MQQGWHEEMGAVEPINDPELEINKDIVLQVDPDKRERPKTKEDRAEIRKKLIQFQLVNYVVAGTELNEAKEKLKKRYALIARRIKESKDADDYSLHLNIFASALDPHSSYFSKDDPEDFQSTMTACHLRVLGRSCKIETATLRFTRSLPEDLPKGTAESSQRTRSWRSLKCPDEDAGVAIDMMLRDVVKLIRKKR